MLSERAWRRSYRRRHRPHGLELDDPYDAWLGRRLGGWARGRRASRGLCRN